MILCSQNKEDDVHVAVLTSPVAVVRSYFTLTTIMVPVQYAVYYAADVT
jgi:hypothetical protein